MYFKYFYPLLLGDFGIQSVVLSGLGVISRDPIPWGPSTTPDGYHVYWSEFKMFDATNSKLLCWDKPERVCLLSQTRPSTVLAKSPHTPTPNYSGGPV